MLFLALCVNISHFVIQICDKVRPPIQGHVQQMQQEPAIYAYPQMYQAK